MTYIGKFINPGVKTMEIERVSLYLNKLRKNLANPVCAGMTS
jgi:hypothetical protein